MVRCSSSTRSMLTEAGLFFLVVSVVFFSLCDTWAGQPPQELALGQAPVLFSGAEGEDADATLLADGVTPIRGDDVFLWLPSLDLAGNVDLALPGRLFKIWDSGPEAGPNGNDDDRNGIRGLDFRPATSTLLLSYEDTTTTGFDFGDILDGDLMELVPTATIDGFITGFIWNRLANECTSGGAGCIGTGDLNGLSEAADGTLFYGAGGTQTVQTTTGTLAVGPSTILHAQFAPDPVHLGSDPVFEAGLSGCPIPFCPGIYIGQLRGLDILDSGLVAFGTSGNYANQAATGNDVVIVGEKADILIVPQLDTGATLLEQRTAEVLYSGALFFATPNLGNSEILGFDILDSSAEVSALRELLGPDSPAGLALGDFLSLSTPNFLRGDVSNDGVVGGLVDGLVILNWAFNGGPTPACFVAADINADGSVVGLTDGLFILNFAFNAGAAPPAPFPNCGQDAAAVSALGCDTPSCP